MGEKKVLAKFYDALLKAIVLQGKIEILIKKCNMVGTYSALIKLEILRLQTKLNELTKDINKHKKTLENF